MPDVTPFRIAVDQAALDDLAERLRRTRWPERETVGDWSQGVPLDYLRRLCARWADDYRWRDTEARLNAVPQVLARVDGLDIHALHARSPHPAACPVLLTHGWPGSFLEFERTIRPLTHPPDPADAFHVVVPSLPGYGFSGKPAEPGWGVHRIARAWAGLASLLGYDRFLAAGSDWGTSVSTSLALQLPERLVGLHLVPPLAPPDPSVPPTAAERSALEELDERGRTGSGYSAVHATRPQTLGYSLLDSPAGLCAWIVEKVWTWADHPGDLSRVIDDDRVLDNVSLYWLTGTGASSARLYWESIAQVGEWFTGEVEDEVTVPTGAAVYPAEVPRPSRRWAARRFTDIVHWAEPAAGGHFAAWEQPESFVAELRATRRAIEGRAGLRAGGPPRGPRT